MQKKFVYGVYENEEKPMTNKVPNPRTRNVSVMSYLETEKEVMEVIKNRKMIVRYAFIRHDKDEAEPHFHIALVLSDPVAVLSVAKWFADPKRNINAFGEKTGDNRAIYGYLTHKNEPDKYQYPESDIRSNDHDYFRSAEAVTDIAVLIMEDMLAGKSRRELFRRYGSAFIWRYNAYKTLYEDIQVEIKDEEYQRRQAEYWSAKPTLEPVEDTDNVFEQMGIVDSTIRKSQVE